MSFVFKDTGLFNNSAKHGRLLSRLEVCSHRQLLCWARCGGCNGDESWPSRDVVYGASLRNEAKGEAGSVRGLQFPTNATPWCGRVDASGTNPGPVDKV